MAKLNPYLTFTNTREALSFYQQCLGGEIVLQTVGEMPEMARQMPPELKDKIMHGSLTKGELVIMASDLCRGEMNDGNTVTIAIMCESEEEIHTLFNKFAEGAKITDPLGDVPWGAIYGALTDKYGKQWLFNYEKAK